MIVWGGSIFSYPYYANTGGRYNPETDTWMATSTSDGPSARAAEGLTILNSVLGSLKGETNWLSSTDRAGRTGAIFGWVIGIAIGVLIVRMIVSRRRAQSSP